MDFYDRAMDVLENQYSEKIKLRFAVTLTKLTTSNFHYFHNWKNFERLVRLLKLKELELPTLRMKLVLVIMHIVYTAVTFVKNEETCLLKITPENMNDLMTIINDPT